MARSNKVSIVCGKRSSGKTYLMKKVVRAYESKKAIPKILVVDTFDSPTWRHLPEISIKDLPKWKQGACRLWNSDIKSVMSAIQRYCYNTVLIFEDATKFMGDKLSDDVNMFILDSKQKNLDIYFLFHFLMAAPKDLYRVADNLTLFKTNEVFDSTLRNKVVNPEIEVVFNRVKAHKNQHFCESVNIS